MGSLLVSLFWSWCGVSVVILVRRGFARSRNRRAAAPAPLVETRPAPLTAHDPTPAPAFTAGGELAPTGRASTAVGVAAPRSVAAALSGIRLPCDLAPLTGAAPDDPSRVVFSAEGHPAEDVGRQVGDELERIGCTLTPLDQVTLQADRGDDSINVRIHPDGAAVLVGKERMFPTAPNDAVVVEFRLR